MSIIDGAGSADRKNVPLFSGLMKYFPDALVEVAKLSKYGNDKHNPGEPLHWSKGKSNDHDDCIARHLLDAGKIDPDSGFPHRVMVCWRALAALQTEIENEREAAAIAACEIKVGDTVIHNEDDVSGTVESVFMQDGVLGAAVNWVNIGTAWYPLEAMTKVTS